MGSSSSKNLPAGTLADPLDRAIEASLRRQFAVPAPLANPGAAVALSKWEWPSLNVELHMPRVTLRAAAGLLLAATLWGSSGLIVIRQFAGDGPRIAAGASLGSAINPSTALGQLTLEFGRRGHRFNKPEEQKRQLEAQNWDLLASQMGQGYGEEMERRVAQLRESEAIELLDVRQGYAANEGLLMLAARVEGEFTVVLIEATEDGASRLRLPPDDRPRVPGAAGLGMSGDAQLFRGRVSERIGYEINATGSPALIPLLFEGAEMRSLMHVYPERYRSPQSVSLAST